MSLRLPSAVTYWAARLRQALPLGPRKPAARDWKTVHQIQSLAVSLRGWPDERLRNEADTLRSQVRAASTAVGPQMVDRGFALVNEALRRELGIELQPEQILAGLVMVGRNIAEMQTGEGKTYAATLPAYIHALRGDGVHVVTANDYLAARDHDHLAASFRRLGMSTGLLRPEASVEEKRLAYAADITYGADQEFGFDLLRDHLRVREQRLADAGEDYLATLRGRPRPAAPIAQRGLATAVVDEIDSVLIDSSTTPLLLSRSRADNHDEALLFTAARQAATRLVAQRDYTLDRYAWRVRFTDTGLTRVHASLPSVKTGLRRPWPIYVEQAIIADQCLRRDVDYIVREGRVMLVDEYTGRILPQRQWRDGLHQSVEVKENLKLLAENTSLARISKQRYFRLYRHLCGMTGTAIGSEREFREVYNLRVVPIPTHQPCLRRMLPPRRFSDAQAKCKAIVQEVEAIHRTSQPILIGARTIENSQIIAAALDEKKISYQLLNGKQDFEEAMIIGRAGHAGAVTIATNMAGRGTDIRLGPGAAALGGLHVIVMEQHESARIDRQLIGRAARRGDPGSCRIYGCAEDPLLAKHAPRVALLMQRYANSSGEIAMDLSSLIRWLQKRVERQQLQKRRQLLQYDDWLDSLQRQ